MEKPEPSHSPRPAPQMQRNGVGKRHFQGESAPGPHLRQNEVTYYLESLTRCPFPTQKHQIPERHFKDSKYAKKTRQCDFWGTEKVPVLVCSGNHNNPRQSGFHYRHLPSPAPGGCESEIQAGPRQVPPEASLRGV